VHWQSAVVIFNLGPSESDESASSENNEIIGRRQLLSFLNANTLSHLLCLSHRDGDI